MPWSNPSEFRLQTRQDLEQFNNQWVAILPTIEVINDASAAVVVEKVQQRQIDLNTVVFTYVNLGTFQ